MRGTVAARGLASTWKTLRPQLDARNFLSGLQRPFFKIDQLKLRAGRELEVALLRHRFDTWPGRKKFSGVLAAVADEEFTLSLPDTSRKAEEPEEVTIAWPFVRKATLVHHFPEPGKKLGGKKDSKDSKGTRGGAA